jgi:hypothetical protein
MSSIVFRGAVVLPATLLRRGGVGRQLIDQTAPALT